MRKMIAFFLLVSVLVVGCTQNPSRDVLWFQANDKIKVLTTLAMIHDLVEQIGGERVVSIPLIRGELDPHSYELVKGDDEKFAQADLIFYNGLGLEHGLSLRQNLEHHPKAFAVADPILKHNPSAILIVDGQYDPHVWMDISLWMQTVEPILSALCEKDPEHADYYQARAQVVLDKMRAADEAASLRLQAIPSQKRFLVTSHDAFHYFTRHYLSDPDDKDWMIRCKAPEGLAPESQMSISDVIAIVSHVKQYGITVLFPESNVSRDSLKKIILAAKEKGFPVRICERPLFGDSMGDAASYLHMLEHNVNVIAEELSHE